jgi:hypothetical protein
MEQNIKMFDCRGVPLKRYNNGVNEVIQQKILVFRDKMYFLKTFYEGNNKNFTNSTFFKVIFYLLHVTNTVVHYDTDLNTAIKNIAQAPDVSCYHC